MNTGLSSTPISSDTSARADHPALQDVTHSLAFASRSILVTGGSKGIGFEISKCCADLGCNVATLARDCSNLKQLQLTYPSMLTTDMDLLHYQEPSAAFLSAAGNLSAIFHHPEFHQYVDRIVAQFGRLDSAVLNAGITGMQAGQPIDPSVWTHATLAQFFSLAPLLARTNGTLIFITSPLVHEAANMRKSIGSVPAIVEPYITAKEACEGWLRRATAWTAREFNWDRVYFIDPGSVDTGMHVDALECGDESIRARTRQRISSGTLRNPAAVANAITKIALSGCRFNALSMTYDLPLRSNERVEISQQELI